MYEKGDSGTTILGRMGAPQVEDARFEQTLMPHLTPAYNLARWLTGDDHDAEDIVQEAYLRAHKSFASLRSQDARPWLLTIVRNVFFDLRQQKRRHVAVSFDETLHDTQGGGLGPSAALLAGSEVERIRIAMNALPPEFRETIVLRAMEGLSYKEIADISGVPLGTVMSRLARARERLGECLDEKCESGAGHELP